ncbi:MAG: hypothetical protein A3E85_01950 [Gammaproteobacteria bacterium RIFCSPHIGHO2_12_FULL_45_12]|nr:MAG: hypothetical protein A3E85_01950 [Gammaproteobacteria bacterium RIFCSPHIGHO2_12_FULL_45_12]
MDNMDLSKEAITVQGPEGLGKALELLFQQCQQDAAFKAQSHYFLYQLKDQQSIIKIDMREQPFLFWYADLQGRAATSAVCDIIARFLWDKDKGGEAARYLKSLALSQVPETDAGYASWRATVFTQLMVDLYQQRRKQLIEASQSGEVVPPVTKQTIYDALAHLERNQASTSSEKSATIRSFGIFRQPGVPETATLKSSNNKPTQ